MKKLVLPIVILLVCQMAHAQQGEILYTDFDPDSTQTFHNYIPPDPSLYLDVDHDGVNEWHFESQPDYHQTIQLFFTYADSIPDGIYFIAMFPHLGDTLTQLPSDIIWTRPIQAQYDLPYLYSGIPGLGYYPPHFIGLKYKVDEGYCYGWIELCVNVSDDGKTIDLTVYRMAFCTEPNYPLRCGQTSYNWNVGVDETHQCFLVHPNPTKGQFSVSGVGMTKVEVYNLQGERLVERQCADETTIDLGKLPSGMYLVTVTDDQGKQHTQKIIKQ